MSAPAYDSYKDSGVEWLGQVPSHWNILPAKYVLKATTGGSSIKGHCANEPLEGLYQGYSASGPDIWLETYDFDLTGLVLSAVGARCGKVFFAEGKWGSVANTHCLIPTAIGYPKFLWYLTNDETWWEKGGTAQPFVKVPDSLARKICLPSYTEQTAIAAFLDRETGKIDALIEAQTRLIELLKEKRQAVISHAVIKGLNPAAPMKDSGVEWLGQVPAHWEVKPLRSFAKLITGLTPPSEDTSLYADDAEGHPWLRPEDLDEQGLPSTASRTLTDEGIALCRPVQARSSLVCCIGTIGKVGFVNKPAATNQQITAIQPSARHRFIYHALISARAEMEASAVGNVLRILNSTRLGQIHLPLPPPEEADAISAHIDCQTAITDELCDHAEAAITLLQERRAALISAAVTGKIDVRGLVTIESEAA